VPSAVRTRCPTFHHSADALSSWAAPAPARARETLAERLDLPFVELDALFWLPDWVESDDGTFGAKVTEATAGEGWVVAGNYRRISENAVWPVNRGLKLLRDLVRSPGKQCCLLCACKDPETCHRQLVAEALNDRFFEGALEVTHL